MILGKPAQLRSAAAVSVVNVAGTTLPVSSQLKSLGVIIDSHIRFVSHVAVIRMCNCHTRALRHVREHLTTKTPTMPSDDAVSAVYRRFASLCAVDTH